MGSMRPICFTCGSQHANEVSMGQITFIMHVPILTGRLWSSGGADPNGPGIPLAACHRRCDYVPTCSQVLMGLILGPDFSSMVNSTPMPGRGVRMSEKRMTPSGL